MLEQYPLNLYYSAAIISLSEKLATPDPTPLSLLLPSVYACMDCVPCSCPSIIFTCLAGWFQFFTYISLS